MREKIEPIVAESVVREDPKEDILKKAANEVAKVEAQKKVSVIVHSLNVRKNASENAEILGLVRSGDILEVSKTPAGAWTKVIKPYDGYVKTEFIADVKE